MKNEADITIPDFIDDFEQLCTYVENRLQNRHPITYTHMTHYLRKAAVLIPLYSKQGQTHILFTKRTDKVEHHKGQISFPGGMQDPQDKTLEKTALRETWEEMGIQKRDVRVLGRTDNFLTNTRFLVTPFVGRIPYPYGFIINEDEIDRVIEVPLRNLLDPNIFEIKQIEHDKIMWDIHYYFYNGDMIWGVTGFLLSNFLSIVFDMERMPSEKSYDSSR
jgi:8-oxo-dGTP pyrophosphatase MutT (NUDIX family)